MLDSYFKRLYRRTMDEAYALAHAEIIVCLREGGNCLDCGAGSGHKFGLLNDAVGLTKAQYFGLEWDAESVRAAQGNGLNVIQSDLNSPIGFSDGSFRCVFGFSVLEHLLKPCAYLTDCYRCLEPGGTLVILTPNISTFFTIALLLAGRMPSSGPHPDSDALLRREQLFKVSDTGLEPDTESDSPVHRHLIIFSYRTLKTYLEMLGFSKVNGHGFGLYPFPNFMQKALERLDPYHCHQMVFVATK
jgi:SAM-dependent methyltransferase